MIELPESERFAQDGTPLKVIGHEISEKLSYEPAKTKVIVYRRVKYGVESGDYENILCDRLLDNLFMCLVMRLILRS